MGQGLWANFVCALVLYSLVSALIFPRFIFGLSSFVVVLILATKVQGFLYVATEQLEGLFWRIQCFTWRRKAGLKTGQ